MKILWLCNIVLPELCEEFGFKRENFGGWITGMWKALREDGRYELGICVPIRNPLYFKDGQKNSYPFFSFHMSDSQNEMPNQIERFKEILHVFKPDIVHIWGTEYMHSLSMVKACTECGMINKVIINIQGILERCAQHYSYGLPTELLSLSVNGRSVENDIAEFRRRAVYEKELFRNVKYVIGRTEWDKANVKQINPNVVYYHCGEILRETFYQSMEKWDVKKCVKHRIFISQAGYPIKGFHLVLESIAKLAEQYNDLQVYVAGYNLMETNSPYANYISDYMVHLKLEKIICFLGVISEEKMYEQYLEANVFLAPSTIENSSNSICEAMRVGTPTVASYVGGNPSVIKHTVSGFLYPLGESYIMEYYIKQIFDDIELATMISQGEIQRSESFNNKDEIKKKMDSIYSYLYEYNN